MRVDIGRTTTMVCLRLADCENELIKDMSPQSAVQIALGLFIAARRIDPTVTMQEIPAAVRGAGDRLNRETL